MPSIAYSPEWNALFQHTHEVQQLHLKDLLLDEERTDSMIREHNGIYLDFSRQVLFKFRSPCISAGCFSLTLLALNERI